MAHTAASEPRKILLIDPGFRGLTGHHFNSNLALGLAAPESGVMLKVLAGDTLPRLEDYPAEAIPFFETDLYDGESCFERSGEFDSWLAINARFAADLKRVPEALLGWADVVVIPSITPISYPGLGALAQERLLPPARGKVVLKFMFSPTWTSWSSVCASGPQMYRDAIMLLEEHIGDRLLLTSEFAGSAAEFEIILGRPIDLLPHPVFWSEDHVVTRRASKGTVNIGFLGYAKREKGFHLLPEVVRRVVKASEAADRPKPRFVIQVNHRGYDAAIVEIERALEEQVGPHLKLLTGPMEADAYKAAVEAVDLMLLPYDPALYRGRGSAVFAEAVSLGVPVIAPRRSGVGDELAAGAGAGVTFERYDAGAVAGAVNTALDDMASLTALAESRARAWRRDNCGLGFLRRIGELTVRGGRA